MYEALERARALVRIPILDLGVSYARHRVSILLRPARPKEGKWTSDIYAARKAARLDPAPCVCRQGPLIGFDSLFDFHCTLDTLLAWVSHSRFDICRVLVLPCSSLEQRQSFPQFSYHTSESSVQAVIEYSVLSTPSTVQYF